MTVPATPAITEPERQRLPNRRPHELLDFEHGGIRYTAGVGRFEDGRPAEIFLNTAKHGTAVDTNARNAAVAASLLLQHGCPLRNLAPLQNLHPAPAPKPARVRQQDVT
jgi:hypothetical protein